MSVTTYWKPGDPRPPGPPRRYVSKSGYVILRWTVAPGREVETREHVWVAGEPGKEVHHLNHVRWDNAPGNLIALAPEQHRAIHAAENKALDGQMIALYQAGLGTVQVGRVVGRTAGNVSRVLARNGVKARPSGSWKRADLDEGPILARLRKGERLDAIARDLGLTRMLVERVRREHGIPAPPPGRPPAQAR